MARLASTLRAEIRGLVSTDPGDRALYAVDASNYRAVPDVVVVPADASELAHAVTASAAAGAPVTLRGGGTSMAGNAIGGVVIDGSRHVNRILDIDVEARQAVVEPGVVLTDLIAAAGRYGLTFGVDPSSASRATLGGMIANNACGAHSVGWGTTADNVRRIDAMLVGGERLSLGVTGSGHTSGTPAASRLGVGREAEIHRALARLADDNELLIRRRFGTFSRQISGYALHQLLPENGRDVARLLCGSEGTLAATLQATVALVAPPDARVLAAFGFPDAASAADAVPLILPYGPLTVESINATLVDRLPDQVRRQAEAAGLPPGKAWLLVELGAESMDQATRTGELLAAELRDTHPVATASTVTDAAAQAVLWRCRRDGAGLATRRPDGAEAWGGWEDAAVPPQRLGAYLRGLDELLARYTLSGGSYGHFGDGCLHIRIDFDLLSSSGIAGYRSSWKRRRSWSAHSAGLFRESTATGGHVRSCCNACTATRLSRCSPR